MKEAHGKNDGAGHQLLSLYKECWRDDHKFFSTRDLELAMDGLCDGTYEMVELEAGEDILRAFGSGDGEADITMRLFIGEEDGVCVKEGTVSPSQARACLMQMSEGNPPMDVGGWKDITDTIEL